MVGGTAYEISGGKALVDGTAYGIKGGKTLVDGTAYEIGFGKAVGDLEVGSSVYMNVQGVATEFLVVHQGLPNATLYDNSCDGTWLLQKETCSWTWSWNDNGVNAYANSTIHQNLNQYYLGYIDAGVRSIIKQVKIPYCEGNGITTVHSGADGLSTKVFLLGGREIGWTIGSTADTGRYTITDGAKLDYFIEGYGTAALAARTAYYEGSAKAWWLRSVLTNGGTTKACMVNSDCSLSSVTVTNYSVKFRPAFILPPETLVDSNFNIIA